MENLTCHICDHKNETSDAQAPFCVRCGADLANTEIERKLTDNNPFGSYATSNKMSELRKEAFIYLTNQRLIVIPAKIAFHGYGLTGALTAAASTAVHKKLTKGHPSIISIPLEDVKDVKDGKFGLLVKALIIETTDDAMVKITVSKRDQWKDTLIKSINHLQ